MTEQRNKKRMAHAKRLWDGLMSLADQEQPVSLRDAARAFGLSASTSRTRDILQFFNVIPGIQIESVANPMGVKGPGYRTLYRITTEPVVRLLWDRCLAASPTAESSRDFYARLRREIAIRRKEAYDKRFGKWTPDNTAKVDLHDILNYIEEELDKFNSGLSVKGRENAGTTMAS